MSWIDFSTWGRESSTLLLFILAQILNLFPSSHIFIVPIPKPLSILRESKPNICSVYACSLQPKPIPILPITYSWERGESINFGYPPGLLLTRQIVQQLDVTIAYKAAEAARTESMDEHCDSTDTFQG